MTATAAIKAACKLYGEPGTFSGSKDTRETIRGVTVKNTAFHNAGCF